MYNYCNDRLILEIKQGESKSFSFNITYDTDNFKDVPFDLTGATVLFQVRESPYLNVTPFISKQITSVFDDDSFISDPENGEFVVFVSLVDYQNLPPKDYYVSIYVEKNGESFSITGNGDNSSIFRICKC